MGARLLLTTTLFGREAARALARSKLRSTLCALGITIGIAAVVCVVAIGRAGSLRSEEQLRNLGDNFVWIEAGARAPNGVYTGSHGTTTLTLDDALAIAQEVKLIKRMTPNVDASAQVVYRERNWRTHWRGVAPDYVEIRRWVIAAGDVFSEADVAQARNVCVLGRTVREQLFGEEDPIGRTLRVGSQLFTVIGLLAPKGQSVSGQDQDDTLLMPYTTAQKKLLGRYYTYLDDILCSAIAPEAVKPAIAQIEALLRQRHHIGPGEEDDFNVRKPEAAINAQLETSRTLALLLIAVASISLVVGGIGIMNVMLVSVAERTREIGLRLAVGATAGAVRLQFLGEAVLLSLLGGLMGLCLGVVGSALLARTLGWPITIPPQALVLAPLFAAAVGVSFGYYPAHRASRLDPIEALRYE
jgi:putative ABC transport system permease protein